MKYKIAVIAFALISALPAFANAAQQDEALAPVRAFAQHFNAGDTAFPSDAFTDQCTVLDEFSPYIWDHSPAVGDVHTWWASLVGTNDAARRSRFLASKEHVTFDAPTSFRVKGNLAYVSMPATLIYTANGLVHKQTAMFITTEENRPEGWRIRAHAWAIIADT